MSRPVTMTREELYDLVWSKSMRQAAKDVFLSDMGLRSICKGNRYPSRLAGIGREFLEAGWLREHHLC
jgi:hypothetical protein